MIPKVGQRFTVISKSPGFHTVETLTFTCLKVDDEHVYGVCDSQKLRFAFSEWRFRDGGFSYSFTPSYTETPKTTAIPPDMLKILIMLCHPDKHNNSPAATKAIKYLLEQR